MGDAIESRLATLQTSALMRLFRSAYVARRWQGRLEAKLAALGVRHDPRGARRHASEEAWRRGRARASGRKRNILFITSDQQRYDALGCNGGRVARTPVLDALAADGVRYARCHVQNVVCMPSRSTMLTGQHPLTHGVIANGVPLPDDAPSVAGHLRREAGYRTALIGKAHFEPHLDPTLRFFENRCAAQDEHGPWRGFEHIELATHGPVGGHHYADFLWKERRDRLAGFGGVLSGAGGGDTGAPEVSHNSIDRAGYHTDWIADRTIAWLESLGTDAPWLCWMSFPDPHHPFDPPIDEVRARIDWRDLDLPAGHPGSPERIEALLRDKPRHWLDWYQGRFRNPEGGPVHFAPGALTHDQVREVNAMIHVENELIDEACGKVIRWLVERGLDEDTDIFYTSDHGELQGDHGLMFKGPYHVTSLLHVPLVWRPAPSAGIAASDVPEPVGHVDLAPTFCRVAGLDPPAWMEGAPLPQAPGSDRDAVITTFDSQFAPVGMRLRTIYRDGMLCTRYEPRTRGVGGDFPLYWAIWGHGTQVPDYDGSEGELYACDEDPHQWRNLWADPERRAIRRELLDDLHERLPAARHPPLPVEAPT